MTDPLFIHALIAALLTALMCGPLGCFVVWQRLGYFGDAIAHAALLGVVGGLAFAGDIPQGVLIVALGFALLLSYLSRDRRLASDALLGVLSHGALAAALVWLSLARINVDVQAYLFGDILTVTQADLARMAVAGAIVLALLARNWRGLLMMTVNEDIARVEGVPTARLRALLMIMIALTVASAIQVVGALLITSMLIVPAAAARHFARSPVQMAVIAAVFGAVAALGGLGFAFTADAPAGPSIILAGIAVFIFSRVFKRL